MFVDNDGYFKFKYENAQGKNNFKGLKIVWKNVELRFPL